MIDLHIHTNNSDGDFSTLEILQKAEKEKLDIISITDHNQISAYEDLCKINIDNYYKGKILVGIELKCVYNHVPMEILAYGFDLFKMKETDLIMTPKKLYETQSNYLDYIKKKGKEIGLFFDNDLQINPKKLEYAAAKFEIELWKDNRNKDILEKNGINTDLSLYRQTQSNPKSIFYIDETKEFPTIQEVISIIHKINGLTFLAHLYEYPLRNHEETIKSLVKEINIDGIECCHSSFSKTQSQWLINFCEINKLLMSGGSDYHGQAKPKIKFAKSIDYKEPIKNELISNWITNVNMYK